MHIADLHIHSRYSRATSRDCTPEYLDLWARKKGISLVGTGDFTHPAWREELEEKLTPAEDGLYVLKDEYRVTMPGVPDFFRPRFVVTGEISSIYKKNDRVRKVHSLILLPGLEDAEKLSRKLESIGNIHSDGRPILGLACHDLLEIMLELTPKGIYVPAHIWTPHFSLFGAFSGFDSVEECYGDLAGHIHAMETGLSSDPPMNWRVSALDTYQLISNSDAHSPAKLGREANLLDGELSYEGLYEAVQYGRGLEGTVEFFPEEGKYHLDGHRKCNLCLSPGQTKAYGGKCPVCGRKLTIGVSHRVEELSDRPEGFQREQAKPFESLVPLPEVIAASLGHAPTSTRVQKEYETMIRRLGPEFEILREVPVEDIRKAAGYLIGEGIERLRAGNVERIPGFDGEYGVIKLFAPWEMEEMQGQMNFFESLGISPGGVGAECAAAASSEGRQTDEEHRGRSQEAAAALMEEERNVFKQSQIGKKGRTCSGGTDLSPLTGLNERQQEAVTDIHRAVAVIAGPGTGKTKTLVSRILYMLENRKIKPAEITAVTFTNKAAREMEERLKKQIGKARSLSHLHVGTFHALCMELLEDHGRRVTLADETETLDMAADIIGEYSLSLSAGKFLNLISRRKIDRVLQKEGQTETDIQDSVENESVEAAVKAYEAAFARLGILDFDDLLIETVKLFREGITVDERFRYLLVDEFQDISPLQMELIGAWTMNGRELFVIGDPDQSIYGFRGSDAGCFDKLAAAFPELSVIRLETNYRSTPEIVKTAMEVISQNPGGERTLSAFGESKGPVRVVKASGEFSEAVFVAKEINRLVGGIDMLDTQEHPEYQSEKPRSFSDLAVLYRTHRQAALLEDCLRKEGVPYVVAGRDDFLMEKNVRGSLAFFRFLKNPEDELARELAVKLLWNLEKNPLSESVLQNKAAQYEKDFGRMKPLKFLQAWRKEENLTQDEGMEKLGHMAVFYKTMPEFLEALSLGVESDLSRCGQKNYTADAVTLMTLHGSKGLEFPVTFLYGVRKGLLPLENGFADVDLEEERRLFFVGITRAKEELIITESKEESMFIQSLPQDVCVREEAERNRKKEEARQLSLFDLM